MPWLDVLISLALLSTASFESTVLSSPFHFFSFFFVSETGKHSPQQKEI
jgi:hypothetical protein